MAFILGGQQSQSFWDKVIIPAKKETGGWTDFTLEVKFRRWSRERMDEWFEAGKAQLAEYGNATLQMQVERTLEYLEDWKVTGPDGTPTPLNEITLAELLNTFPGSGGHILQKFVGSTYGAREKNS